MAEITEARIPKSQFYRVIATGEVLPALKHPAGYEDDFPKDFAPCAAPDAQPAPEEPEALEQPWAAVQAIPAAPAPQAVVPQTSAPVTIVAPYTGEPE